MIVSLKAESFSFSYTDKKLYLPSNRPLTARLDITNNRIFYTLPENYNANDILSGEFHVYTLYVSMGGLRLRVTGYGLPVTGYGLTIKG